MIYYFLFYFGKKPAFVPIMSHSWDTELDEDEANSRVYPVWSRYQKIFERRGFRLDTCLDVKRHYEQYCSVDSRSGMFGYLRACSVTDENALCNDPGLVSGQAEYLIFHMTDMYIM